MKDPTLASIIIGFFVLSAIFYVLERLFAANRQKILRRGFKTDLIYWFFTPIFTKAIEKILVALALVVIFREGLQDIKLRIEHPTGFISTLPIWLQAFLLLFVGDVLQYWIHRWFHGKRLWKFHAVHHSSEDLDWLSAVRQHPVNDWASRVLSAVPLLAMGFNPLHVVAYIPFLTLYAIGLHANVNWTFGPLKYMIASPVFHRWHHTSQEEGLDKNFAGLFPVIDMVFGTYYMPKGKFPEKFGAVPPVPEGFWAQMIYPFRRAKKKS